MKYADPARKDVDFVPEEPVLLKVSPWKGLTRFGKKGKLSPRFVGPFEILKPDEKVAYELALPPHMQNIHNVFSRVDAQEISSRYQARHRVRANRNSTRSILYGATNRNPR